jgi:hypothetical protein
VGQQPRGPTEPTPQGASAARGLTAAFANHFAEGRIQSNLELFQRKVRLSQSILANRGTGIPPSHFSRRIVEKSALG